MQESEHERLVLAARTELEALHGGRAIQAEEQPHDPTGGPHLSWMLARSLQLWKSGNVNYAYRWLGHVEGTLSAQQAAKVSGALGEGGSPMNEQEQRVWAATFAGLLAANEPANHAMSDAYQAAQLVRDYSQAQGFEVGDYFPKGWAPPER